MGGWDEGGTMGGWDEGGRMRLRREGEGGWVGKGEWGE